MRLRLDLRIHPDSLPGRPPKMVADDLFGCADCGRWYQFAWQLVHHDCETGQVEWDG